MSGIKEKVIILTGASEGIGAATARRLAKEGAKLVLAARNAERLRALADEIEGGAAEVFVVPTDLADPAHRERLVADARARFKRIDVLVNNAAVGLDATAEETTMEEARYLMEVNFFAPLHLAQLVLPTMRAQQSGQIVNVSSVIGMRATPSAALYSASKYALNGLSDAMRVDLYGTNIQVTDIYPGLTATTFAANQLRTSGEKYLQRGVKPEKAANAIVSAIAKRPRARYVSFFDRPLVWASRLLPGLAERVLAGSFRKLRGRFKGTAR